VEEVSHFAAAERVAAEETRRMTTPDGKTLTFRLIPGLFTAQVLLGLFILVGLAAVVVKGTNAGELSSPKGLLILALALAANIAWWTLIWNVSHVAWRFTLLPTRFVADNRLRGQHVDIPWGAITSVKRVDMPWWQRWGVIYGVSAIETNEGHRILFWLPMTDYEGFLNELRSRAVNLERFDPSPVEQ
jgi:hypothetical protein